MPSTQKAPPPRRENGRCFLAYVTVLRHPPWLERSSKVRKLAAVKRRCFQAAGLDNNRSASYRYASLAIFRKLYVHVSLRCSQVACFGHHAIGFHEGLDTFESLNLLDVLGQQREAALLLDGACHCCSFCRTHLGQESRYVTSRS